MRIIILSVLLVFTAQLGFSINDTIHVTSEITDVTVFFEGAQVHRHADVDFVKGKYVISVDSLPLNINQESIQVEGIKHGRIVSVQMQLMPENLNFVYSEKISIEDEIELQTYIISELNAEISVFDIEKKLLLDNISYSNNKQGSKIAEVKEAAAFYRSKLMEIHTAKLKLNKQLKEEQKKLVDLSSKLRKLTHAKSKSYNQILVGIESETVLRSNLKLNYYIKDAGWEAEYDFRVEDINQPLTVVHNASIYQLSGEDWRDIKITLATENPSLGNELPELTVWKLGQQNYAAKSSSSYNNSSHSSYEYYMSDGGNSGTMKGRVVDSETQEPIPFANVVIEQGGQQRGGASTDFDGYYTIKPIAPGTYSLTGRYVGYQPKQINGVTVNQDKIRFVDFSMNSSMTELECFEVADYEVPLISKDQTSSGGTITSEELRPGSRRSSYIGSSARTENIQPREDFVLELAKTIDRQEFELAGMSSIRSESKMKSFKIKEQEVEVDYKYHAVPRMEKEAFLTAEITNREDLDLLSGISKIYFKGTYTGEAYIEADNADDTLRLSLGRDKDIIVEKSAKHDLNDKMVSGNRKEQINWNIVVRNTKSAAITLVLLDQIPLSERKSIEIELTESSGAKYDPLSGELKWEILLNANDKAELDFGIEVKYPRYMNLNIK
ncbi:MAG: mucoidy inhibitor MuiA family protein [Bacteroidales bacterium]|nr:mucoidy inhibitor MuiA family protein [Bacteroidales bacterium]